MAPVLEETPPAASDTPEAPSTPQPESQPLRPGVEIELSKSESEPQPQGEVEPEVDYAKGTPAAEPALTPAELDKLNQEDWHRYNVRNHRSTADCPTHRSTKALS
jgi:hypothetical protein